MRIKSPKGISFNFGIGKHWIPSFLIIPVPLRTIRPKIQEAGKLTTVKRFGFRLDILLGTLRRPVPKIYKREFWLRHAKSPGDPNYVTKETAINPWNSGHHWFGLTIPVCPGFFSPPVSRLERRNSRGFMSAQKFMLSTG